MNLVNVLVKRYGPNSFINPDNWTSNWELVAEVRSKDDIIDLKELSDYTFAFWDTDGEIHGIAGHLDTIVFHNRSAGLYDHIGDRFFDENDLSLSCVSATIKGYKGTWQHCGFIISKDKPVIEDSEED